MTSLVVVPGAPLLLPEYTGRQDAGAPWRQRAVDALRAAVAEDGAASVVLVAATDREPRGTRPPLAERVGRHLVERAGTTVGATVVVAWDAPVAECRTAGERLAHSHPGATLVVVADGTARRGEKAPGHLDPRAFALDEEVLDALRAADPGRLLALDPDLCAALLMHGRAPLQVAAAAWAGRAGLRCATAEAADPYGVQYLVARLTGG
ncbi:hypothetical protein H9L10_15220 [Phycicoccus endophyticus]|uniref:Uncharacterized protein n=1 Tax=Phycicoccus endophyticus TaxID=1690220 RepID=A0A7G9R1N0_9MICO|nr:hypothetical protein [Phycicoccus endophyticus]NHI18706.1 hypothetical protein [Phycicoccus endophyticus]QNN49505.1 hypothetical protein H9L10_15220 [Phycicoccus endophyticus]GGL37060.1 hypothetical protein GCM10012283_19590 [Phycicoccus endophyticus]